MTEMVQIGKAAKLAGVSVDTIRFYQKLGLLDGGNRSPGGYRLFSLEQIRDLQFVRHAQELGFSLTEVGELLALRGKHHVCSGVQAMLKHKLTDVREKIRRLGRLETDLTGALRNCNRELRLKGDVKHQDCCPLLTSLDQMNGSKSRKYGSNGQKSAGD